MKKEIESILNTHAVLGTNRAAEATSHQNRSRCVRFTTTSPMGFISCDEC